MSEKINQEKSHLKPYLIRFGTFYSVLAGVFIVYFIVQSMLIPLIITIISLGFFLIALFGYKILYGKTFSMQFAIITIGTLSVIFISWFKDFIFPNFNNLSIETSKLLLPLLLNAIVGFFAVFGVAFSIWSTVYVFHLKSGYADSRKRLRKQVVFLLVFLIYFALVLFFLFIQPLYL
ncbi:unnamed protein product, partial [marine sediment metagenome]